MKTDIKTIAEIIEALDAILEEAYITSATGRDAINAGEQNQAIGALHGIDKKLEEALALHGAVIALHRRRKA